MPYLLDRDDEGRRIYISDEIRCDWVNLWWGACIRNPRHRGRPHLVIGHGQFEEDQYPGRYLEPGELVEVPKYTRRH